MMSASSRKFGCQPAKRESIERIIAAAVHTTATMENTRILEDLRKEVRACSKIR